MDKARRGMIGIYQIENVKTGETYIGSSASLNNRIKVHMTDLARGIHINRPLQESWNKHGPQHFRFSILEITEDKYSLDAREIEWIKKTGAMTLGFNTKTDQYKQRTFISIHMQTKKDLEDLKLGSMNSTIKKLIDMYTKFNGR